MDTSRTRFDFAAGDNSLTLQETNTPEVCGRVLGDIQLIQLNSAPWSLLNQLYSVYLGGNSHERMNGTLII